jgi:hypothetical protein
MMKYTQFEQQAAMMAQQLQTAQVSRLKLQSFHNTKFERKKENFEGWDTQYQAE